MAEKNNKINLKIRNTEKVVFEGEVDRISSFNEVGRFDIYPTHANFISIIRKELTLYYKKEEIKHIDFDLAILKIKNDIAKIFLGIEVITLDKDLHNKETVKEK